MRPDILVHNYPIKSQDDLDHLDGPSARTKSAIFEIKGLRVSDQLYPRTRRATDIRAANVLKDYEQKAKALDVELCPELITANLTGAFAFNGIIPVVFGAFGETNHDFDSFVRDWAKLAAKTRSGSWISPEAYGSTCSPDALYLASFRRYLGVQIVKANARHKRQRLHLVGRTEEEAKRLAHSQPSRTTWNPNTDCPSRFKANYTSYGPYQTWFDFLHASGARTSRSTSHSGAFRRGAM